MCERRSLCSYVQKLSPEQKKKVVAALQANIEPWQTLKVVYQVGVAAHGDCMWICYMCFV